MFVKYPVSVETGLTAGFVAAFVVRAVALFVQRDRPAESLSTLGRGSRGLDSDFHQVHAQVRAKTLSRGPSTPIVRGESKNRTNIVVRGRR